MVLSLIDPTRCSLNGPVTDIHIASDKATFVERFVKVGIVPSAAA
jgi:hypothetical protein